MCRFRRVPATAVQCFIIGGLSFALGIVPVPLPYIVLLVIHYAITVYVTMKYLGVSLMPDGLLIPGVTQGANILILLILQMVT